jgi:hypothetical protein
MTIFIFFLTDTEGMFCSTVQGMEKWRDAIINLRPLKPLWVINAEIGRN